MSNKNLSRLLPTPSTVSPVAPPLLQELYPGNWWAQLLIPFLCQVSSGERAGGILELILIRWPTLEALAEELEECFDDGSRCEYENPAGVERYRVLRTRLVGYLAPLGLADTRADRILAAAAHIHEHGWPASRSEALKLEGYGGYSADSYLMFVLRFLPARRPQDGVLGRYWDWAVVQSHLVANCQPKTAQEPAS